MMKKMVVVLILGISATFSAQAQAVLNAETNIEKNGQILTRSGNYSLVVQDDGNAVVYFNGLNGRRSTGWSTGTRDGNYMRMQMDGNLALYRSNGTWAWNAGTGNHPYNMGYKLVLYETGRLAIVDANNQNLTLKVLKEVDNGGSQGGTVSRFPFRKGTFSGCIDDYTPLLPDGVQASNWAAANSGTIGYCNSIY